MATTVIAQVNCNMPRIHGDAFIHIDDIDFVIHHDEPLLEYEAMVPGEIAERVADAARQRARWLAGQLALPTEKVAGLEIEANAQGITTRSAAILRVSARKLGRTVFPSSGVHAS